MDIALEVTSKYKPWESGQVVVGLSRTKSCKQITIVTDMSKRQVVTALWGCLCKITQWTAMVEEVVGKLSVSATSSTIGIEEQMCMNMIDKFPLRVCDYSLPISNTGYVYMMVSLVCHEEIYIGQTGRNLPVRLSEHNSGKDAVWNSNQQSFTLGCSCIH